MREKPKDKGRLLHILDSISNINEFLKDKTAEDFLTDKMLYNNASYPCTWLLSH